MTETAGEFEVTPIGRAGLCEVSLYRHLATGTPMVVLEDEAGGIKSSIGLGRNQARHLAALLLEAARRLEEKEKANV